MNEEPEIPQPLPELPRGALAITLLIPPLMTFLANMAIGLLLKPDGNILSIYLPMVIVPVILAMNLRFHGLVWIRYRGISLFFLTFAYFLGQIILCLTLWIGSCALFIK